ncbi:MAG TPA: hypothetical protein VMZ26_15155 [Pyrinomonadaceae bacterium]|nr:hypothetical protein [Pyrinomonadaceae bacterium]
MLNKLSFLLILATCLGCGSLEQAKRAATEPDANTTKIDVNLNTNKSLTDTAVEAATGEKKLGIVECDEAMETLIAEANDPDDNFVTKAVKKTALNTFRDHVKKKLDESKTDRKEVAKFCKDFRDNLAESANENSNANSSH